MKIYVISRPTFDYSTILQFLKDENAKWTRSEGSTPAEELTEFCGRVCYMSFGSKQSKRNNSAYIRNLIFMGHESVLEHASWSFLLTGISRAFTHQLVRHRVGFSFSQLSQQYHEENDAVFIAPAELLANARAKRAWTNAMRVTRDAYSTILSSLKEEGATTHLESTKEVNRAIRSAARSVLPNATETKIVVTGNARALRYFLKVRGGIPGDLEMRQVSAALLKIVKEDAPALFADFRIKKLRDGSPIVRHLEPSSVL